MHQNDAVKKQKVKTYIYYSVLELGWILMGGYLLYNGIETIIKIVKSLESNWLLPISVTFFLFCFATTRISGSGFLTRHMGKKGFFLLLMIVSFILVGSIPFFYSEVEVFQQLFSTDSAGVRQTVLTYSSFAASGFLMGSHDYFSRISYGE